MLTARQKVLAHLRKTRAASAREIARALKMSAPNVRHHLSVLRCDGRVDLVSINLRGGRGRPEKLFSLSQASLGDNLAVLADALLDEKISPEKIGRRIAQTQGLTEVSKQPLTKRLGSVVGKLSEMHYQAHWEAGAAGPRVIFGRCPYAKVIEKHPELCKMDIVLLEESLARPISQFTKSDTVLHGLCPFIFEVK